MAIAETETLIPPEMLNGSAQHQQQPFSRFRFVPGPPAVERPQEPDSEAWEEHRLDVLVAKLNPLFRHYHDTTRTSNNSHVVGAVSIDLQSEPPAEIIAESGLLTHPSIFFDWLIEDWSNHNGKKDKHIGPVEVSMQNAQSGCPNTFKQDGLILTAHGEEMAKISLISNSKTHGAARYGDISVVKGYHPSFEMRLAILLNAAQTAMEQHTKMPTNPQEFPHFHFVPTNN